MKITIKDDFDLSKIADSGQCFRFNAAGDGYSATALDKNLFIKSLGNSEYELDCSKDEFDSFWRGYFDLDLDYRSLRKRIDKDEDPYLFAAAEFGKGIRILRQDPWEMLLKRMRKENPSTHFQRRRSWPSCL